MAMRVRKLARQMDTTPEQVLELLRGLGFDRYRSPDDMVPDNLIELVQRARHQAPRPSPSLPPADPALRRTSRSLPPVPNPDLMGQLVPGVKPLDGPAASGGRSIPPGGAVPPSRAATIPPGGAVPPSRAATIPPGGAVPPSRAATIPPFPPPGPDSIPPVGSRGTTDRRDESLPGWLALEAEAARLAGEKAALAADAETLRGERAALEAEREAITARFAAIEGERTALEGMRAEVEAERARLREGRDAIERGLRAVFEDAAEPVPREGLSADEAASGWDGKSACPLAWLLERRGLRGVDEYERAIGALARSRQLGALVDLLAVSDPQRGEALLRNALVLVGGTLPPSLPRGKAGVQVAPERAEIPGWEALSRDLARLGEQLMLNGRRRVLVVGGRPTWHRLIRDGIDPRVEIRFAAGRAEIEDAALVVAWGIDLEASVDRAQASPTVRFVEIPGAGLVDWIRGLLDALEGE